MVNREEIKRSMAVNELMRDDHQTNQLDSEHRGMIDKYKCVIDT